MSPLKEELFSISSEAFLKFSIVGRLVGVTGGVAGGIFWRIDFFVSLFALDDSESEV